MYRQIKEESVKSSDRSDTCCRAISANTYKKFDPNAGIETARFTVSFFAHALI
ncbi:hypothetical Protein YC6258_00588 [Gynuella sunshinyii YC6258]|uniref:Uncharacterized protein n=1 Tax=Gynuella sunshinyii YC6258 TaxID=1445510 RepID=A0A0C5VH13_9GAMM|nr:hypothetical Protein YC6258_00588 [Gynuella sunshinyii YC6258]